MVGVALLVCGIGALLFIKNEQIEALDDQLRNEAHTFFGEVVKRGDGIDWQLRSDVKAFLPITRTERFVEIIGPDGRTLYRSKEPKHGSLNVFPDGMSTVMIGRDTIRLGVFVSKGMKLCLGAEMNEINADASRLMASILVGLPLLVGIIALGGWWIARKALAPMREITTAAEQISAADLHRRLPSPRAGDEIGRLTEVLNAMFDRLETSFGQATRFSADASHELKTPLTVLRSSIEDLLESSDLSATDHAAVSALLEQTHRLSSITESLLLLSRADAGRLKLDVTERDVVEIITACVDDARIMAEPRGIEIETDLPSALTACVDGQRLGQIVLNLLDNAVKYNRERGTIRISASVAGDAVNITVANTGPGISSEHIPHLFERFYRAGENSDAPGHGLGLSLARELARAHGGDLTLVKSDAEWTVFAVHIPGAARKA